MNKHELANALSEKASIDKEKALEFIDAFIVTVKDGLKKGEKINISGLGTFMLTRRQAYTGKNPQTGEKLEVPEIILPYFKPSDILKESVK